jgi:EAL domain-containing protein (putative c-di-GMP-specific phosphodiesterase class I)
VPPERFIRVAEESGLIAEFDQLVMSIACRRMAAWTNLLPGLRMALNASSSELGQPDYVQNILSIAAGAGIAPASLQIELTETTAIIAGRYCVENLQVLRRHGISIALDDFGTGYSSLSRLYQLPVDALKIDKSFVGLTHHPLDKTLSLIEAVVAAGRAFRLQVVAEGVETAGQLELMTSAGCEIFQGMYLGNPMPARDVETLLRSSTEARDLSPHRCPPAFAENPHFGCPDLHLTTPLAGHQHR